MKYIKPMILALMLTPLMAAAAEHTVSQENQQFSKSEITIAVGDVIKFLNNDEIFHNVFSLSDTKFFDLGSYPKGESRSVTFDKAGVVEVECAIHPDMKMTVNVK
ncbi:MAG: plastocyanin/azurin family copper-binding protein [Cellvibrionaceae bacterium]|nr:plastocyanin/azurin family copper-binding protein [Cellvibrionaceae bacterium]